MDEVQWIGVGFFGFAMVGFIYILFLWRQKRAIKGVPTTSVDQISEGAVRVEGTVDADGSALQAPLTGIPCVAYDYEVRVYRLPVVKQKNTAGDGGSWQVMEADKKATSFAISDGTGKVHVDAAAAKLELYDKKHETGKEVHEAPGSRRCWEKHLALGAPATVIGYARRQGDRIVVGDHKDLPMFLVSDTSPDKLVKKKNLFIALTLVATLICIGVGSVLLAGGLL